MDAVTTTQTARIGRPVRQVYRAVATRDLANAWQWDLVEAAQSTPGLPAEGARAREWERVGGVPLPARSTLVGLVDDAQVTWRTVGVRGTVELAYTFTGAAGGCQVSCRAVFWPRLRLPGWRARAQAWLDARVDADLSHLRGWLEEGIHDAGQHADGLLARVARRITRRRVRFDVRAQPVSDAVVTVEVDRRHATCRMHCHFCPRTAAGEPRELPPPDDAAMERVRVAFERAVYASTAPLVTLWSDDILRYPGLFDLLDILQAQGRRAVLHTPGLSLADRAFAARFVGRPVRFDITVHADEAATFTAMCGNPDGHRLVHAALDNLHALGIPFDMAVVVTERNVARLGPTLRLLTDKFAPSALQLRLFYPDADHLGPAYDDQFPSYAEVMAQLAAAAPLPELHTTNLPACQVQAADLAGLRVRLTRTRNWLRTYPFPACDGCPARDLCPGVHPAYTRRFTVTPPSRPAIEAVLAACVTDDTVRAPSADAGPAAEVLGRVALHGVEVIVERRRPRPYWLADESVGVWYRVTDPTRQAEGEATMHRARERLAGRPLTPGAVTEALTEPPP